VGIGVQVEHVLDPGLEKASDSEIWALAGSQNTIAVSKEVDFFLLANRPGDPGRFEVVIGQRGGGFSRHR